MRKIFSLILTGLMVLVLVSCKKDQVRIKFDINGGSPKIDDQIIKKGEIVIEPKEELLKAGFEFQYWTKDDIKYDFTTPVYENIILKAYFKEVIDNNGNKEEILSHTYDFSSISLDQTYVTKPTIIPINNLVDDNNSIEFERLNTAFNETNGISGAVLAIRKSNTSELAYLKTNSKVENLTKISIDYTVWGNANSQNLDLVEGIYVQTSKDGNDYETVHNILPDIKKESSYSNELDIEIEPSDVYVRIILKPSGKKPDPNQMRLIIKNVNFYTLEEEFTGATYDITYNYNYDNAPENTVVKVREGNKISNIITPSRRGFTFLGWYESNLVDKFDFNQQINANHVLYALWNERGTEDNPSDNDPNILKYYNSLVNLDGDLFTKELRRLIRESGKTGGTPDEVKNVDEYEGKNYNIYDGYGGYGNREHVWPKSKLGSAPDFDLHNLRAAVISTNSKRANDPFGEGSGTWSSNNGKFYPGDEHVGDVARIILYIHVRYNLDLNLVGNLNMFLMWHKDDPVDDFERSRNNKIQGIKNSRNPFIDYPEYVDYLFGSPKYLLNYNFNTLKEVEVKVNNDVIMYLERKNNNQNNYIVN